MEEDKKEYTISLCKTIQDFGEEYRNRFKECIQNDVLDSLVIYEKNAKMKLHNIKITNGEKSIEFYPNLLEDFERDVVTRVVDNMMKDKKTIGFDKES